MSENAFKLELPSYLQIYLVINLEYLKLFEPSMIIEDQEEIGLVLASIEYLAPSTMYEAQKKDLVL